MTRSIYAQWLLVLVTLLWGSTFLTLQIALRWADPVVVVALRFILASFILFVLLKGRINQISSYEWKAGIAVGLCIFGVYTLQTIGLATIPSSTSAFLTGLYIAFVPLLQWLFLHQKPTATIALTTVMAFCGMALFANPFALNLDGQLGEWITILSALICAVEILTVSYFASGCRPLYLSFTQMVTVAVLASGTLLLHDPVKSTQWTWGLAACVGALAAIVAFVQFGIGWALKYVSALKATLIYSLEPVFAGIMLFCAFTHAALLGEQEHFINKENNLNQSRECPKRAKFSEFGQQCFLLSTYRQELKAAWLPAHLAMLGVDSSRSRFAERANVQPRDLDPAKCHPSCLH